MDTLVKPFSQPPFFFGNYLNMARHNAFNIIKYLSEKYQTADAAHIGMSQPPDLAKGEFEDDSRNREAFLFTILDDKLKRPDTVHALVQDLMLYFPMLRCAHNYDPKKGKKQIPKEVNLKFVKDIISQAMQLLHELRNAYTHYTGQEVHYNTEFPFDKVYQAAFMRLSVRFEQFQNYDAHLKFETTNPYTPQLLYTPKVKKQVKGKKSQPLTSSTESGHPITEKTLTFFICLFLERKYATAFLQKLEGFNSAGVEEDRATIELYKMFCCRLPQPRLESGEVLLDMLNELAKCPNDLYEQLSEDHQKTFIPNWDAASNEDKPLLPRIRHDDRFPYFALRYFDDTKAFPSLRFQLQLGKRRKKDPYIKPIFGIEGERILLKPIRTFARLGFFSELYENILHENPETGERTEGVHVQSGQKKIIRKIHENYRTQFPKTWIEQLSDPDRIAPPQWQLHSNVEQFSPFYNIQGKNIGLKFVPNATDRIFPDPHQENEKPDAILSTYELQSLFLYDWLYKSNEGWIEKDTETFIKNYIQRIRRFLSDVKNGNFTLYALPTVKKGINQGDAHLKLLETKEILTSRLKNEYQGLTLDVIPDAVREYLLGYQPPQYAEKAAQKIATLQSETSHRLSKIAAKEPPKVGQIATWLAENIQWVTRPRLHQANNEDHFQKLNNEQFRALQRSLAYFPTYKTAIQAELKRLNLTTGKLDEQHPFLYQINFNKCNSILEFYKAYLEAYKVWLELVSKFIMENDRDERALKSKYGYMLPMKNTHDAHHDRHNKNYEDMPTLLPRGLFKDAIDAALKKQGHTPKTEGHTLINSVYALELLSVNNNSGGDTQPFYNWQRYIRFMREVGKAQIEVEDKIEADLERIKQGISQLSILETRTDAEIERLQKWKKRENRHYETKQIIRYTQANDRALWLMVQKLVDEADGGKLQYRKINFSELSLTTLEAVLNTEITMQIQIGSATIVDKLPIRRYGDFRRFLKDLRLTHLLRYKLDKIKDPKAIIRVQRSEISEELDLYDRLRIDFFEKIYQFEQTVYTNFKSELIPLDKDHKYYTHATFLDIALTRVLPHIASDEWNCLLRNPKLKELRNKILHNEIPYFDWLNEAIDHAKRKANAQKKVFSKTALKNMQYDCYWVFEVAMQVYDILLNFLEPYRSEMSQSETR